MSAIQSEKTQSRLGKHAVVIGGSIAGLLTARVLSDYFDTVTI
jgi:heterodisulfide reductase subunit A-like polyferredoxin